MKKQSDVSSASSNGPSRATGDGSACSRPVATGFSEAQPPPSTSIESALQGAVPTRMSAFGIEFWDPGMTEEESEALQAQVVRAFQAVWKPNLTQEDIAKLTREELRRRGLTPTDP